MNLSVAHMGQGIVRAKRGLAGSPTTCALASWHTASTNAYHGEVGALAIHPRGKVGELVVHSLHCVLVLAPCKVLVAAVIREHEEHKYYE